VIIKNNNTKNVTSMKCMFKNCKNFNCKNISDWDVSKVRNMDFMFNGCLKFNQNLFKWKVDNVTSMKSMFHECLVFDGNVSSWNVSQVTNMKFMYQKCFKFHQDLSGWDVRKVDFEQIFHRIPYFLSNWQVTSFVKRGKNYLAIPPENFDTHL
jgi:surface protein